MMKLKLKVKQEECEGGVCPMPLTALSAKEGAVTAVKYDEESGEATIEFDENKMNKQDVKKAVKDMKYEILEEL